MTTEPKLVYVGFANARLPDTDYRVAFGRTSSRFRVVLALPDRPTALPPDNYVHLDVTEGMSLRNLRNLLKVPLVLRRSNAQCAHFFATQYSTFGPPLAWMVGVPSLVTVTGLGRSFDPGAGIRRRLYRRLYLACFRANARIARLVLFQNETDLRVLRSELPSALQHKCRLVGSAVDEGYFPAEISPSAEGGLPVCTMVARLLPAKGVDDFIDVAESLRGRARFVLIGPASASHPDLLERVMEAARTGAIEYVGQLSDAEVRSWYLKAAVVALPSRSEGVPRVLLEAALSGRPVVAYDIPACAAVLPADQLVEAFDVEAFRARATALLEQPALREAQAVEAVVAVRSGYSVQLYTERLEGFLAEALGGRGTPA